MNIHQIIWRHLFNTRTMILILDSSKSLKNKTWLVDQLSTINTSFHELPNPESEVDMVIKIF